MESKGGDTQGIDRILQAAADKSGDLIGAIVEAAKDHLEADIGFLAEFRGESKVIRRAAGDGPSVGLEEGTELPLGETYCHRVVRGELPSIVADARADARVKDLAITRQLKIGAYIGVPVRLPGGRVFGTLCCINHEPDPSIHERDVKFMRVLADLVGRQLERHERAEAERQAAVDRIRAVIAAGGPTMVFQPIVDLASREIVGAESLARFELEPRRTPDRWFAEAWEAGLGVELEIVAIKAALAQLPRIDGGAYLSVNVSPETLRAPAFLESLAAAPAGRVVVEVTEHAAVEEYAPLVEAIGRLRGRGIRLAVDDVGAGYSGLSHILRIAPDLVKLDVTLTRGIHGDLAKQALASAAVVFASRVRVGIVAEGVETAQDAETLRVLGVRYGQGYLFARPGPLPLRVNTALAPG
jgi:EAL domain-containing protein (putative c-di-GMP-specific phosphodiesterase class I)